MLTIIYPEAVNWFYRRQAEIYCKELMRLGFDTEIVSSTRLEDISGSDSDSCVFIVSVYESILAAERAGQRDKCIRRLMQFSHRILVNFDSIFTPYFQRHFEHDRGLITGIIDISMLPQIDTSHLDGVPYAWVRETLSWEQWQAVVPWSPGRPIPWAIVGHTTPDRAALVAVAVNVLGTDGLVFMPPIRPYNVESGFEEAGLLKVLRKCNLYLWGSHHKSPYHEGLRAVNALLAGAIPAKIDPIHHLAFNEVPWVYECVESLRARYAADGPELLYFRAREFFSTVKGLGEQFVEAARKLIRSRLRERDQTASPCAWKI